MWKMSIVNFWRMLSQFRFLSCNCRVGLVTKLTFYLPDVKQNWMSASWIKWFANMAAPAWTSWTASSACVPPATRGPIARQVCNTTSLIVTTSFFVHVKVFFFSQDSWTCIYSQHLAGKFQAKVLGKSQTRSRASRCWGTWKADGPKKVKMSTFGRLTLNGFKSL